MRHFTCLHRYSCSAADNLTKTVRNGINALFPLSMLLLLCISQWRLQSPSWCRFGRPCFSFLHYSVASSVTFVVSVWSFLLPLYTHLPIVSRWTAQSFSVTTMVGLVYILPYIPASFSLAFSHVFSVGLGFQLPSITLPLQRLNARIKTVISTSLPPSLSPQAF